MLIRASSRDVARPPPPLPADLAPYRPSPDHARVRPSYGIVCRKRASAVGVGAPYLYCVIMRRHSVGFLELVRGRWRSDDSARVLLADVPPWEMEALRSQPFEDLWRASSPWRLRTPHAPARLKALREAMPRLLESVERRSGTQEWEFAKGKPKGKRETPLQCALREFEEAGTWN